VSRKIRLFHPSFLLYILKYARVLIEEDKMFSWLPGFHLDFSSVL
jgi:hypothetical protein